VVRGCTTTTTTTTTTPRTPYELWHGTVPNMHYINLLSGDLLTFLIATKEFTTSVGRSVLVGLESHTTCSMCLCHNDFPSLFSLLRI
jgi:hypothetical protein